MIPALKLMSLDNIELPTDELDKYFRLFFSQASNDLEMPRNTFLGVLCDETENAK